MSFTSNSSTIAPKGEQLTHQTSGDPTKALAKRGTARRFKSTAMPPAVRECASDYTSGLDEDALRGAGIGIPSRPLRHCERCAGGRPRRHADGR
jgi:hypothetical protein